MSETAIPSAAGASLADYDFALPEALIAQQAVEPRDAARLLVASAGHAGLAHHVVADLPSLLPRSALLVVNDTRVVPARLLGHKSDSGGAVELLLVAPFSGPDDDGLRNQRAIARSSKPLRVGQTIDLDGGTRATIRVNHGDGQVDVDLEGAADLEALLTRSGHLPLPPYLRGGKEDADGSDRARYQTAWAAHPGSIAAPTAGLHFTPALLQRLEQAGIERAAVTLHVGPGTFLPVRVEAIAAHRVLAERFEVSEATAEALRAARRDGRPIIAVGTTTTRVLETLGRDGIQAGRGETGMTLLPGHRFALVQGLMTNFHLPRSSLLLLAAFAGRERVLDAYRTAVASGYRFYSYGDASLWLP